MKKNLFYLFMLMAVAAMPLTSCEKESQDEEQVEELRIPVTTYDALSWLQGSLVVVDENGDILRRIYGNALDESQPDVISIPVVDYTAAEELFLSWVAPTKEATKVDGGYDYNLTDMTGQAQGSVSFRAIDGEAGVLARMSVAEGTDLKHISEVNFIDSKFWPENAAYEKFEAGKIYYRVGAVLRWTSSGMFSSNTFNGYKTDLLPFYCIQGNTDGQEAILIWISPDYDEEDGIVYHPRNKYYLDDAYYYLPTEPQAQKVLNVYNNNKALWNKMLNEMDALGLQWSPQKKGSNVSEFMLQKFSRIREIELIGCLDLDEPVGEIYQVSVGGLFAYYRYMNIETIPAVAE